MENYRKILSKRFQNVILRVVPGHFVTPNAHVNYYIDMTALKFRTNEARATAQALSSVHSVSTPVDTIICMDGTEIIGAYLAEDLTRAGVISMNAHKSIYVLTPEFTASGQMIFRDNLQGWIRGKNVLILFASVTTGTTVARAVETVKYYGARISGISAVFSVATKVAGMPVNAIFSREDLPDYASYESGHCDMCKAGLRVDGICNGFGISPL